MLGVISSPSTSPLSRRGILRAKFLFPPEVAAIFLPLSLLHLVCFYGELSTACRIFFLPHTPVDMRERRCCRFGVEIRPFSVCRPGESLPIGAKEFDRLSYYFS